MMDEMLPEEIPAIRDSIRRFMATEVVPVMDEVEARGELPRDLIRKAGEAGYYGATFPEEVGGSDMGYLAAAVIIEEIARADIRFGGFNQNGGNCPACIYLGGTQDQIDRYVPDLLAGNIVGMMALTEAGGGSDAAGAMKTTARRDGDVYKLNGSKMWATLGDEADVGVLFAKTDPEAGARGVSAFIVEPKKFPGYTAQAIDVGLSNAFRVAAVYLDDFTVPAENLLGNEGEGFKIIMRALQGGRAVIGAKALGIAIGAYEDAVRYANERVIKGSPIGKFQMIQGQIAEMAVAIEASRALVYQAAQAMDRELPTNRIASIAKFHASTTAKFCADTAQQIYGGYGLSSEYRISRYKKYADLMFTGEGTANVQKILIAEDALGYKQADRHHGKTGLRQMGRGAA
ncbi:acyl-CoA dehydrogenase family protein [Celeribacter indicus]|uniref:3-sulfinopropanoyl-CoA desulfinase n=1 Tax=Celeribacter indicus TaxID=1208324 RepID=A0A0B5E6Y2_9RHOB|nr:acyl-CoA dehydrogenase family protein [Celeribacter indicus]AJE49200.1 acyl-CoA dehydrogenase yngJ [Celeribacter indicus]SDX18651.1 isovaleryl-CoA dehydrogenase [Celeribacter indicus]